MPDISSMQGFVWPFFWDRSSFRLVLCVSCFGQVGLYMVKSESPTHTGMDGGLMRFNHQWEYGDDMNDIYLLPGMKPSIL